MSGQVGQESRAEVLDSLAQNIVSACADGPNPLNWVVSLVGTIIALPPSRRLIPERRSGAIQNLGSR